MKITWVGIFLVLLTVAFAAESFQVEVKPIKDTIFSDETAEVTLEITNFALKNDRFLVFSNDPSWLTYHEGSYLTIESKSQRDFTLILDPTTFLDDGRQYSVPITIKSIIDDESIVVDIPVSIQADELRSYKPNVFVDAIFGEEQKINPQNPLQVRVRLINKNPLDIEELKVVVSGPLIQDSFTVALPPKEKITKILEYSIDPLTRPQDMNFDIAVVIGNDTISQKRIETKIISTEPGFRREVLVDTKSFLFEDYQVKFSNVGNVQSTETIEFEVSTMKNLFTNSNLESEYSKDEGKYLASYDVQLQPGEEIIVTITTDYRTFTYTIIGIILLIVLSIYLYYKFRSPILINRRVEFMKSDDEDSSKVKVILNVKNRTSRTLDQINVIERVPNITEVEKEFSLGTLKPTKIITSPKKGTFVRWDFTTLEGFEERIITYTIRSKLSILGNINLPATIVRYDKGSRTHTVKNEPIKSDEE